ncbi:MAG: hypothetical protein LBC53_09610 [Spirochaetaceae bacterium]|nr:hypothetical protein [Spirochaetaceae bacterium]
MHSINCIKSLFFFHVSPSLSFRRFKASGAVPSCRGVGGGGASAAASALCVLTAVLGVKKRR